MDRQAILVVSRDRELKQLCMDALGEDQAVAITDEEQFQSYLESDKDWDLCLLDVNLPEMTGFDVYRAIRSTKGYETLPVIYMAKEGDAEIEEACLAMGAVDFVRMPCTFRAVGMRVARALRNVKTKAMLEYHLTRRQRDGLEELGQDDLTGLWNRHYTEKAIQDLIANGASGALFILDLDNFKAVNDMHGHIAGDQILKDLANVLRRNFRSDDILCRLGGDEFLVFAPGLSAKSDITVRAKRLISDMDRAVQSHQYNTNTSISVGIAIMPEDGTSFKRLYYCGDKALYFVKQHGKHSYCFYSDRQQAEEQRAASNVDLMQIEAMFERLDGGSGAYLLDFGTFPVVYNFIRRFVDRNGRDVQIVLFTIVPNDDRQPFRPDQQEHVLELLDHAIYVSLRRVDASTRYSDRQVIVLLMDSNTENGEMVAQRVIHCFEDMYTKGEYHIRYDIAKMPIKQ